MRPINIEAPEFSAIDIFNEGRERNQAARAKREETKKHILRVGDAGCVTEFGEFIGANPHKTLARFMGYEAKIPKGTYNIFDNGFGNEFIWEDYIRKTDWAFQCDEEFPLVDEFSYDFPLTGRPDGVFGTWEGGPDGPEFAPVFGVEHKAICSGGTAKTVFDKHTPKTENLIQAATYSMGFDIPWSLVYTSNSNYNYSKNKADKMEFPLSWREGVLWFQQPNGKWVETIITANGIADFYGAICEAFLTKDHSFFRRESIDYQGAPYQNWDEYETFGLMVDKSWDWDKWEHHAKLTNESDVIIQFGKVNRKPTYSLFDVVKDKQLFTFETLREAREKLYNEVLS